VRLRSAITNETSCTLTVPGKQRLVPSGMHKELCEECYYVRAIDTQLGLEDSNKDTG